MDFEHPVMFIIMDIILMPIEEPLGWQELYNILVKTEKLYEKVINKFKRNDGREGYSGGKETEGEAQPDFLPPVALGILQARLNSEQRKRNAAFTECGTEADVGESHMSVLSMLETRLRSIQRRHITVLVIGEYNAGKSTFLNILLGGRYLPVDRGKVTMLVCDVRHCTDRRAELIIANDRNTKLESESVPLSTDVNSDGWETVRNSIKTKKYGDKDLRRVIIHWPIPAVDKMLLNVKSRPRRPQTSVIEIPQVRAFLLLFDLFSHIKPKHCKWEIKGNLARPFKLERQGSPSPPTEPKVLMKGSVDSATSPPTEPKVLMKGSVDSAIGSLSTDADSQTIVKQPFPPSNTEEEDGSTSLNAETPVLSVSFLDCPGINHEDATGISEVLDEYENSNATIIILNTADDDGIKANGIKRVLSKMRERDACIGKITDGDSMLFIANKADHYTKEDDPWKNGLRNEVLEKLTRECNWLNVSSAHVIPVESEKINTEISKQNFTHQEDMYRCMQMFLRKAYRADLEQNTMWLMSLLQHSRSIVESNLSPNIKLIKHNVDNWKKESLEIQNIPEERKQREKTELVKLGCSLQQILEGISVQEVTCAITLQTIDSAVRYIANINWSSVSKEIDKLVCEMLTAKKEKEIQLMGVEYERTVSAIYSEERGRLKKLKESVFVLKNLNFPDNSIVEAALSAMAGPILSMYFRISPIFFPAMFLVLPVIPLGLIIYSIYESLRDAQQESERKSFEDDRLKFVQERVAKIHKDATKMLPIVIENASEYEAKRIIDSCLQISLMLDELDSNSKPIDQACKDNIIRLIYEVADLFFGEFIGQINSCGVTMSDEHNVHCWKMKQIKGEEYSSDKTKYMLEFEHCVLLRQMSRGTCGRLVRILGCSSEAPGKFVVTLESGFRNLRWLLLRQPQNDPAIQRRLFQHTSRECQQCIKSIHAMGIVHGHLKVSSFVMVRADRDNENLDPAVTDEVNVVSNLQFILKLTIADKNESGLQETIDDHFVAPEVKLDSSRTTTASDVYSLGVICVYLWHGVREDLFGQRNMAVFSKRPIDCVEADEFITKCLEPNPRDRRKLSKK
ncbi:uncharacterized protein LOC127862079 isoform X4 [Dreissena polymorpha]|uniref:uncharacterized protein LOC127862079 isoform X4 n=1 Tax=Dreissena polymorpha TaxID=45954 RepID=UPI002264AF2F|nr:uncharacterized protein LOC127862079 isoform X4 [Dreissena polymorpha]